MIFTILGWVCLIAGMKTTKYHAKLSAGLLVVSALLLSARLLYILLGGN